MSMVCPQCHGSFSQRLQCPSCGVRLEYQAGHAQVWRDSVRDADLTQPDTGATKKFLGFIATLGLGVSAIF